MRVTKTVDVDAYFTAEDVAEWFNGASQDEREDFLRATNLHSEGSMLIRYCRAEAGTSERKTGPIVVVTEPKPVEIIAIISECGRFAAHVSTSVTWKRGILDWTEDWSVTHIRTGLRTSVFMGAELALQMLDEVAALVFDDFGSLNDPTGAGVEAARAVLVPVASKYRDLQAAE